jgi:membrane-bound lytic murein transglycosylase D
MDKKKIFLWSLIALVISSLAFSVSYLYVQIKRIENRAPIIITENERRVSSPPIPEKLEFCGEPVPLNDFDVYERMDRELLVNSYWHSSTLLYLKRANRWFPIIEPILEKHGIPNDFKYMAVAESGLTNVVSPAGAAGFWQLMIPSAEKYGLLINNEVDERYNLEKATEAAALYLKESYQKFGNWTLTAASYNNGVSGVERQIKKQNGSTYYSLFLNEETYRFVFRIIALKEIFENPKQYGFYFTEDQLYPPIGTIEVNVNYRIDDLAKFADKNSISYKTLKLFNPWLRDSMLINKEKKTFKIKIPKSGEINFSDE